MVERGRGAVINVASTAAFQPLPGAAIYAASKAFVLSFSEAIRTELRGSGVTVTAVCPGPVRTEFTEAAGMSGRRERDARRVLDVAPRRSARQAVDGAERDKRVVVPGASQPRRVAARPAQRRALWRCRSSSGSGARRRTGSLEP